MNHSIDRLVLTNDGSHTLYNAHVGHHYHSIHGAFQETWRVYIELGLLYVGETKKEIKIFEMGFGTGFNCLFTLYESLKQNIKIDYTTIEAFPISRDEVHKLNYDHLLKESFGTHHTATLSQLHQADWHQKQAITEWFNLTKLSGQLESLPITEIGQGYDLIYYDAFAPNAQPELWTIEVFEKLHSIMADGGVLTTYSSKGDVRRNLIAAGFRVEKHAGPGRKREVLRAIRA